MYQTPRPTDTAVASYSTVLSGVCITVHSSDTQAICVYIIYLVYHQPLPSSSVPHAHTATTLTGGQYGLVVGVVTHRAGGREEGAGRST